MLSMLLLSRSCDQKIGRQHIGVLRPQVLPAAVLLSTFHYDLYNLYDMEQESNLILVEHVPLLGLIQGH
jgi:hypothetical protein